MKNLWKFKSEWRVASSDQSPVQWGGIVINAHKQLETLFGGNMKSQGLSPALSQISCLSLLFT